MASPAMQLVTRDTLRERVRALGYARWEVVDGEVVERMPAKDPQGRIAARLHLRLGAHVEDRGLGATFVSEEGFKLSDDPLTIRAPDLAFVSNERFPARDPSGEWWPGAPDLAVEVVSESDGSLELERRIRDYFGAGARQVWVVYPGVDTVRVHTTPTEVRILEVGDTLDGGDVVPGFSCPVAALFAPLSRPS